MGLLKLTIDRQNKALVSLNGSAQRIPGLFQENTVTLQITIVDPTGQPTSPYTVIDMSGAGLRVSIGQTPTGTQGGPPLLALQDTFTWNATGKYFQADLSLATSTIDNFIGAAASASAFFEVNVTSAGNRDTILQVGFTLLAVCDELASTVPAPVDQYLTKAECLALFAKLVNDLGARIVLKSANGVYGRELGVNNDGTGIDNIINL